MIIISKTLSLKQNINATNVNTSFKAVGKVMSQKYIKHPASTRIININMQIAL